MGNFIFSSSLHVKQNWRKRRFDGQTGGYILGKQQRNKPPAKQESKLLDQPRDVTTLKRPLISVNLLIVWSCPLLLKKWSNTNPK